MEYFFFFLPPVSKKNTQSFLLVEGSAVDRQSRLSAKCKHISICANLFEAASLLAVVFFLLLLYYFFLQCLRTSQNFLFCSQFKLNSSVKSTLAKKKKRFRRELGETDAQDFRLESLSNGGFGRIYFFWSGLDFGFADISPAPPPVS